MTIDPNTIKRGDVFYYDGSMFLIHSVVDYETAVSVYEDGERCDFYILKAVHFTECIRIAELGDTFTDADVQTAIETWEKGRRRKT